jgi:hypothetical protein
MADVDNFADMRGSKELRQYGSLGGEGIDDHQSVSVGFSPDGRGFAYQFRCMECGTSVSVCVTWQELVMGMMKVQPVDPDDHRPWLRGHGGFSPDLPCRSCGRPLVLVITPDEFIKRVKEAVDAESITQAQVNNMVQQLRAQMAGHGRR